MGVSSEQKSTSQFPKVGQIIIKTDITSLETGELPQFIQ